MSSAIGEPAFERRAGGLGEIRRAARSDLIAGVQRE
jgi:hypothetical protein